MRLHRLLRCAEILVMLQAAVVACKSAPIGPTTGTGTSPDTAAFVVVSGGNVLRVGTRATFTATAYPVSFRDRPVDVTTQATWRTSDQAVAMVSSTGIVTAVRPGAVNISATYLDKLYTLPVTVFTPTIGESLSRYIGTWVGNGTLTCQRIIGGGRDLCAFPTEGPIQLTLDLGGFGLTGTLRVYRSPTTGPVQAATLGAGVLAVGGTLRPAEEGQVIVQLREWQLTLTSDDQLRGTVTQDDAFMNVYGAQLLRDQLVVTGLTRQ